MGKPIIFTKQVDVQVSVRELAEAFSVMSNDEQAKFFAEVAAIMDGWEPHARDMQIHYMASSLKETERSRWLFDEIAEYFATPAPEAF